MLGFGGLLLGRGKAFNRRGLTVPRGLLVAALLTVGLVVVPVASAATPANPLLAGPPVSNSGSLSGVVSVAISGNYVYTPSYYSGVLTAVDISNPAAAFVAGQSAAANALLNASTINIAGGLAYVVSKNANGPCLPGPSPMCGAGTNDNGTGNSLSIYDISTNPAVPTLAGSVTDPAKLFGAYGIAVSGHYAYVAAQGCLSSPQPCPDPTVGNRFDVIDLSNLALPTIVASVPNPSVGVFKNALSHATSVAIHGSYAYVTAFNSSQLTVIDISNPTSPAIVASITNPALNFPSDVVVGPTVQNTTYAYVANQSSGGPVTVVDVSTPSSPQVVGSVTNAALNGAYRIRLHGNFAYVSGSSAAAIAAVDISDPTHPSVAGSLTDSAHLHVTTGLDVDSSGQYVVATSPYLLSQTKPTFPPYTPGTGGPTLTGTISAIQIDPVPVGVSITASPTDPTTQTTASFTFSRADAVSTTSCSLDGATAAPCASATTQTYSGLAPGTHTFTVEATDAAGNVSPASYSWTIEQAPANTGRPTISGSASQGNLLTASSGAWTGVPAPTFSYTWADCDAAGTNCSSPIAGATSSTYTAQSSDAGLTLEVTVTGSNGVGSASSVTSAPTAQVTAPPANTARPSISGTASQGNLLTASAGTWTGVPAPAFAYQWSDCDTGGANCRAISGATSSSYTLGAADVGARVRVSVVASNSAGFAQAVSPVAAVVTPLLKPPAVTPAITGLRQSAKTWRETAKPAHPIAGKPKPKHLPTGTTFSLSLNVAASVSFRFTLNTTGRKVRGRCRTQTSQNRHQPRCGLKTAVGTLVLTAHKGANQVRFSGHLAHGKKLRPGAYTVTITATAEGKSSKTSTLKFTIAL